MRRVVVTGLGVVTPIGTGTRAFCQGLKQARPGIGEIRSFDARTFPTRIAGEVAEDLQLPSWITGPEHQTLSRDPKSRFGAVAADEALVDAFGPDLPAKFYPSRRISAFLAAGLEIFHLDDVMPHVRPDGLDGKSLLAEVMNTAPGSRFQIPAHLAARAIARRIRAEGLVSINLSACTAGTQALGEAFLAIREGAADVAVAGGYDSMVNPLGVGGFCMLDALSRSNHLGGAASRPFDAHRDGFVLGEGSGMCVLEEAQAARARGARIHAEIVGYASSLDAYRVSDPDPDQTGAVAAMRLALDRAAVEPSRVDYINAHGTSTRKNDPAETRAIRRVFDKAADRIPVSSIKGQIGHLIGAAGAVEFIASVLAVKQGFVPATINLEDADPECDLDYVPLRPRPVQVQTFVSNSFGFGGQNAVIVAGRMSS